jgi:predicted small metal-binding protein
MEWSVTCECGWSFRGAEDDVVAAIQRHGREVHGIDVTREEALAQARPA